MDKVETENLHHLMFRASNKAGDKKSLDVDIIDSNKMTLVNWTRTYSPALNEYLSYIMRKMLRDEDLVTVREINSTKDAPKAGQRNSQSQDQIEEFGQSNFVSQYNTVASYVKSEGVTPKQNDLIVIFDGLNGFDLMFFGSTLKRKENLAKVKVMKTVDQYHLLGE